MNSKLWSAVVAGILTISTTPSTVVAQNVFVEARNVQVTNGVTPSISFDVFYSANAVYTSNATNDVNNSLFALDAQWDIDFGIDGTTAYINPSNITYTIVPVSGRTSFATAAGGGIVRSGVPSPAGYETRAKISIQRTTGMPDLTSVPTKLASVIMTVAASQNAIIGTPGNGASITLRVADPATQSQTSKWSSSNVIDQPVGASSINPSPLPLDLLSFDARKSKDDKVNLTWTTSNEKDINLFEVERSGDGKAFEASIASVKATGMASVSQYEVMDGKPLVGNNFYRLKIVDQKGRVNYS